MKGENMNTTNNYVLPVPITDSREEKALDALTDRYNKLVTPGKISAAAKELCNRAPDWVKTAMGECGESLEEVKNLELIKRVMRAAASGFAKLEELAAEMSVNETSILQTAGKTDPANSYEAIPELCLARSYNLAENVRRFRVRNLILAFGEGAATGAPGIAGMPFNIALSMFLYFRAVQSVAMMYGYDVKNDSAELSLAGDVFTKALSPADEGGSETAGYIMRLMAMGEATAVKSLAGKTWTDMAAHGGAALLLTQIRALSNLAAKKALQKAGKKGLEKTVFTTALEQIGKKLTLKAIRSGVPVVSAVIGGLLDTEQMSRVIEFADIFYQKRFIMEKGIRINDLIAGSDDIVEEYRREGDGA